MGMEPRIHRALDKATREALGHDLPDSVKVTLRDNRLTMIGPPATGKTRTAQALFKAMPGKLRIFTGTGSDDVCEETDWANERLARASEERR